MNVSRHLKWIHLLNDSGNFNCLCLRKRGILTHVTHFIQIKALTQQNGTLLKMIHPQGSKMNISVIF